MRVYGLGLNYLTGEPLAAAAAAGEVAGKLFTSLQDNIDEVRRLTKMGTDFQHLRGEVQRARTPDYGDPKDVGWTYIVHAEDPRREAIMRAMRPLAEHRGMTDPERPLLWTTGDHPERWYDWLMKNHLSASARQLPYYNLIVGGPERIPLHFQSFLGSVAAAGRLDFDEVEELEDYVAKVLRLDLADAPVVDRSVIFFATDEGPTDATHYSCVNLAEPLAADLIASKLDFSMQQLLGEAATKAQLRNSLGSTKPALVFAASHGVGALGMPLSVQKDFNGAICCHAEGHEPLPQRVFGGSDVPRHQPFLEGSIFFQFACFSAATPRRSDFNQWLSDPRLDGEVDFISALPKRLVNHPRGPLAFVGHIDTAFLHAFDDPDEPRARAVCEARRMPFSCAMRRILVTMPVGYALAAMTQRYNALNAQFMFTFERLGDGGPPPDPEEMVNDFITRTDAQNYIIIGDPAARVRIPEGNTT